MAFFEIGVTIKDAVDDAIQKSGVPGADLLLDGVVRSISYPFYGGYQVEGTACNSNQLKAELGELKFNEFCKEHDAQKLEQESK